MEDYIVYRKVTELQGTVIRAKSIEDANKKKESTSKERKFAYV